MLSIEVPSLVKGDGPITAWFLEIHDLALAKLAAGREKDLDFVFEAVRAGLLDVDNLRCGLPLMPDDDRKKASDRLETVLRRAAAAGGG
jgi:hypothetical protein